MKMVEITENARLKARSTKTLEGYFEKAEREAQKVLGKEKGSTARGIIETTWKITYLDKEDMEHAITWDRAILSTMRILGIIRESTYAELTHQLDKLRIDLERMPF